MKNILLEIVGLAGFANAILYIGGFFRKLENDRQSEASAQNTRLSVLEGKVEALIQAPYCNQESYKVVKSCDDLKDLFGDDFELEEE